MTTQAQCEQAAMLLGVNMSTSTVGVPPGGGCFTTSDDPGLSWAALDTGGDPTPNSRLVCNHPQAAYISVLQCDPDSFINDVGTNNFVADCAGVIEHGDACKIQFVDGYDGGLVVCDGVDGLYHVVPAAGRPGAGEFCLSIEGIH